MTGLRIFIRHYAAQMYILMIPQSQRNRDACRHAQKTTHLSAALQNMRQQLPDRRTTRNSRRMVIGGNKQTAAQTPAGAVGLLWQVEPTLQPPGIQLTPSPGRSHALSAALYI